jgi:hypothetical protein
MARNMLQSRSQTTFNNTSNERNEGNKQGAMTVVLITEIYQQ